MENSEVIRETTPKVSLFKNALTFGLYTGIAYVLISLLYYALDVHRITWLVNLTYIVLLVGIVLATINYRDKINGGYINYGRALATGFYVSLIVGLIFAIYTWIFHTYIHTEGIREMIDLAEQKFAESGLSDEMIETQMSLTSKFMTVPFLSIMTVVSFLFTGTIISLITSIFLKKNNDTFNATFTE